MRRRSNVQSDRGNANSVIEGDVLTDRQVQVRGAHGDCGQQQRMQLAWAFLGLRAVCMYGTPEG